MVILTVLLLPITTVWVLLAAQVGLTIVTKARLQVAADRAVYAAAQDLANTLHRVAKKNWLIRREFLAQQRQFTTHQQQSQADARRRVAERQHAIDQLRTAMDAEIAAGYTSACQAALAVVQHDIRHKTPWATVQPLSGHARVLHTAAGRTCVASDPLFDFGGDQVLPDQWVRFDYSYLEGGERMDDPTAVHTDQSPPLLQYRIKPDGPAQQVAFALRLQAPHLANWLDFFAPTDDPDLVPSAVAAAQPVGGDLRASAWLTVANEDEWEAAQQAAALDYVPTLVPLRRLQDRSAGYAGLSYYDDEQGWTDDDHEYAH